VIETWPNINCFGGLTWHTVEASKKEDTDPFEVVAPLWPCQPCHGATPTLPTDLEIWSVSDDIWYQHLCLPKIHAEMESERLEVRHPKIQRWTLDFSVFSQGLRFCWHQSSRVGRTQICHFFREKHWVYHSNVPMWWSYTFTWLEGIRWIKIMYKNHCPNKELMAFPTVESHGWSDQLMCWVDDLNGFAGEIHNWRIKKLDKHGIF